MPIDQIIYFSIMFISTGWISPISLRVTKKMLKIIFRFHLAFRYLWRGKHTFAIAQHKHHRNIYEEADACKRRKRYARPLVDLHMKIYRYEGLEPWSIKKSTVSGKGHNKTSMSSCALLRKLSLLSCVTQMFQRER